MTNTKLLNHFIKESGKTKKDLAKKIGIKADVFYKKINNKRDFYLPEAELLKTELKLTGKEATEIFFS